MSQFYPKVNIRAFRWLELAIIHSINSFFFVFFWMEGGGMKHFLTYVGGLRNFWGTILGSTKLLRSFFKHHPPPLPYNTYFNDDSLIEPGVPETGMCGIIFLSEIGYGF